MIAGMGVEAEPIGLAEVVAHLAAECEARPEPFDKLRTGSHVAGYAAALSRTGQRNSVG